MEIFKNSEWLVTQEGIEGIAKDKGYWIAIDRVFEETSRDRITYYDWPVHLAEKECVPVPEFLEAFDGAIRFAAIQTGLTIDEPMLARTYRKARTLELLTQQYETNSLRAILKE